MCIICQLKSLDMYWKAILTTNKRLTNYMATNVAYIRQHRWHNALISTWHIYSVWLYYANPDGKMFYFKHEVSIVCTINTSGKGTAQKSLLSWEGELLSGGTHIWPNPKRAILFGLSAEKIAFIQYTKCPKYTKQL